MLPTMSMPAIVLPKQKFNCCQQLNCYGVLLPNITYRGQCFAAFRTAGYSFSFKRSQEVS